MSNKWFCPNCGAKLETNDTYNPWCVVCDESAMQEDTAAGHAHADQEDTKAPYYTVSGEEIDHMDDVL